MFQIGDIVEWVEPNFDYIIYYGVVEEIKGDFIKSFTVRWFDDGIANDYPKRDLKLVESA
jgi:hypothetical protein